MDMNLKCGCKKALLTADFTDLRGFKRSQGDFGLT